MLQVYLWNGFSILGSQPGLVRDYYALVEETERGAGQLQLEDRCLLHLLKGICLKEALHFTSDTTAGNGSPSSPILFGDNQTKR